MTDWACRRCFGRGGCWTRRTSTPCAIGYCGSGATSGVGQISILRIRCSYAARVCSFGMHFFVRRLKKNQFRMWMSPTAWGDLLARDELRESLRQTIVVYVARDCSFGLIFLQFSHNKLQ